MKNISVIIIFFLSFLFVGFASAQGSVPGSFSISSSGCFQWTPAPAVEVNFLTSSSATDYAANRRIAGTSSWTMIIGSANNIPLGQGPIRLTTGGDLDDYTVFSGNTYEYQVIAKNSSGQTVSSNTAVITVN